MPASAVFPTVLWLLSCLAALAAAEPVLSTYQSKAYTLHTDVTPDKAREALLRMTKMAEEYALRTRDFAGVVSGQMPFYLYKDDQDFFATGAPRDSGGYFDGDELVARAGALDNRTWHIVQHEGFHQYAHQVIRGNLPPWVDEGLAEYFGEGVFTGDGYVTGIIPAWRLARVRETLKAGKFKPMRDMMRLTHDQWNDDFTLANYDQGWAMVHFLAHGDGGRYQAAFSGFIVQLGSGKPAENAWDAAFGTGDGFEARWRDYWLHLPENPTTPLIAEAHARSWASFLARATAQGQQFESFDALLSAAQNNALKSDPDDWLPPALLAALVYANEQYRAAGWRFGLLPQKPGRLPQVVCTLPDETRVNGCFALTGKHPGKIWTTVTPPRKP